MQKCTCTNPLSIYVFLIWRRVNLLIISHDDIGLYANVNARAYCFETPQMLISVRCTRRDPPSSFGSKRNTSQPMVECVLCVLWIFTSSCRFFVPSVVMWRHNDLFRCTVMICVGFVDDCARWRLLFRWLRFTNRHRSIEIRWYMPTSWMRIPLCFYIDIDCEYVLEIWSHNWHIC